MTSRAPGDEWKSTKRLVGGRGLTFDALTVVLTLAVIGAAAALAPTQSDTFWHLRAGQEIVGGPTIPLVDTYSHTAYGLPWPNHEWLWQAGAFLLFDFGGFPFLALGSALMAFTGMLLAYRIAPGDPRRSAVVLLLALPLVSSGWSLRPQVASHLAFVVLLWLLTRERYRWVPVVFLLWANAHGAVAMGGLVVVTALAFAGARSWRSRAPKEAHRVRILLVVTGISAVATLLTPLGLGLWTYIVTSIPRSRLNGIQEWAPAVGLEPRVIGLWLWSAALVGFTLARWRRLRGWPEQLPLVVALVLLPLAFTSVRNTSLFVLASIPALVALTRREPPADPTVERPSKLNFALALLAVIAVVATVGAAWSLPHRALGWEPVPSGIVAAIRDCPGPLYNRYDEGGYLIWAVPEVPVFVDSRQDPYPQEFLTQHFETEPSGDYDSTFAQYAIRCAALPPDSPTASTLIKDGWIVAAEESGWVVLYST